jgi:hypothetical protein
VRMAKIAMKEGAPKSALAKPVRRMPLEVKRLGSDGHGLQNFHRVANIECLAALVAMGSGVDR